MQKKNSFCAKQKRPSFPRAIPSHFLPLLCLLVSASRTSALIFVNIQECDESSPCRRCEGNCKNDDSGCFPGLKCFGRKGDEAVPGCEGNGQSKVDYCYLPEDVPEKRTDDDITLIYDRQCDQFSPCGLCEGDCDSDADCLSGFICFKRDKDEDVPGCVGDGTSAVDYCYDPNDDSVKEDDVGQGSDSSSLAYVRDCDKDSPCDKCMGECSNDSGCVAGLKCFERSKKEAVPGCDGKGERRMNYCYDPDDTDISTETSVVVKTSSPTQSPALRPEGQVCRDSTVWFDFITDGNVLETDANCKELAKKKGFKRECNFLLVNSDRKVRDICPVTCGACDDCIEVTTNKPQSLPTLSPSIAKPLPSKRPSTITPRLTTNPSRTPTPSPSKQPSTITPRLTTNPSRTPTPSPTPRSTALPIPRMTTHPTTYPISGPTFGSTVVPTISSPLRPSYSPSFAPTVPLLPSAAPSDPAEQVTVVAPLSTMTLSLTFLTVRRMGATSDTRSLFIVNEVRLLRIIAGALTSKLGNVYPSFRKVVLELLLDGKLVSENGVTVSYALDGSVHFLENLDSSLPSQGDLDETVLGALNNDNFLGMLQQSGDPILASVHNAEVALASTKGGDVEGITAAEPRDAESSVDNDKVINIVVPVVIASAALLAAIAVIRRRKRRQERSLHFFPQQTGELPNRVDKPNVSLTAVEASILSMAKRASEVSKRALNAIPSPSKKSDDARQKSPTCVAAYLHELEDAPPDVDESICGRSMSDWSVEGVGQNQCHSAPTESVVSSSTGEVVPELPDSAYAHALVSDQSGSCDESRSISSFGTDNLSAVGLARISSVHEDEEGYEFGTIRSTEVDLIELWTKKRHEIETALGTSGGDVDIERGTNEGAAKPDSGLGSAYISVPKKENECEDGGGTKESSQEMAIIAEVTSYLGTSSDQPAVTSDSQRATAAIQRSQNAHVQGGEYDETHSTGRQTMTKTNFLDQQR